MAVSRGKISMKSRKKGAAEQAFDSAETRTASRWERFKENALVQGVAGGVFRFGRFVGTKMQHAGQDLVAGYHGFRDNHKDRHAVSDWGSNIEYLQSNGVQFDRQEDGSFKMTGTSDKGRSLIARFEAYYGGETVQPQEQEEKSGFAEHIRQWREAAKERKRQTGTESGEPKENDFETSGAKSGESAKETEEPTVETEGTGVFGNASKQLKDNAANGMDAMLTVMMKQCEVYLSMSDEDKAKNFGDMASMFQQVGNMMLAQSSQSVHSEDSVTGFGVSGKEPAAKPVKIIDKDLADKRAALAQEELGDAVTGQPDGYEHSSGMMK